MTKQVRKSKTTIPTVQVEHLILFIRGQKVILDSELAILYGVETRTLLQAVKRNMARFPADFMFQLNQQEFDVLRSQSVISKQGGRRYPPYAFTEQGVAMLSGVLNSDRAINVNIEIMRAFVRLRQMLASNKKLAQKIDELEQKYDDKFKKVFEAIKQLMSPSTNEKKRPIGFVWDDNDKE